MKPEFSTSENLSFDGTGDCARKSLALKELSEKLGASPKERMVQVRLVCQNIK